MRTVKQWECLEEGCGALIRAGSDDELVAAAQAHVREAHGSIELEEVILAGAAEVPDGGD